LGDISKRIKVNGNVGRIELAKENQRSELKVQNVSAYMGIVGATKTWVRNRRTKELRRPHNWRIEQTARGRHDFC
jgi:hypothetical protein